MPWAVKFHPFLVHFSIALFTTGVLLEWLAFFIKNERFEGVAGVNLLLSGGAILLTVASGLWARDQLQFTGVARSWLDWHQTLAFWISSGVLGLVFWQVGRVRRMAGPERWMFRLTGTILLVGILLVGYQGGKLVFDAGLKQHLIKVAPPVQTAPQKAVPGAEMYPEEH